MATADDAPLNDTADDTPGPTKRRPRKPAADNRVGTPTDPSATGIGFEDGRTYRCADGVIVERLT